MKLLNLAFWLAAVPVAFCTSPEPQIVLNAQPDNKPESLAPKKYGKLVGPCENLEVVEQWRGIWLEMNCDWKSTHKEGYGGGKISIALNDCIGNQDGVLVWQRKGNFGRNCTLSYDGSTGIKNGAQLYVECPKLDGTQVLTHIDLEEGMTYRRGNIVCNV
ncbi:hypothetical protein TWF694_005432 [Orbilia ellipsospora]|uniref:Cyanovirin-N domain-containing protein n=1 Tax=Orbilia ellipsospora TaxID=2528407 RepID=A0AAV9WUE8_9PEZI